MTLYPSFSQINNLKASSEMKYFLCSQLKQTDPFARNPPQSQFANHFPLSPVQLSFLSLLQVLLILLQQQIDLGLSPPLDQRNIFYLQSLIDPLSQVTEGVAKRFHDLFCRSRMSGLQLPYLHCQLLQRQPSVFEDVHLWDLAVQTHRQSCEGDRQDILLFYHKIRNDVFLRNGEIGMEGDLKIGLQIVK